MAISRKVLCVVYGLIGLVALVGTWSNNLQYPYLGLIGSNVHFWQETLVNPASRSITVDIFFFLLAANIWMLLEARRLSMRWPWVFLIVGFFVAISAAFPAFLIYRELKLADRDGSTRAGTLSTADLLGLVVLGAPALVYLVFALRR